MVERDRQAFGEAEAIAVAECPRCRYRSTVAGGAPAEALLSCARCGARGCFVLVSAERSGWFGTGATGGQGRRTSWETAGGAKGRGDR